MPAAVSVGTMLKRLSGLVGTADLNDWQDKFIRDQLARTNQGAQTSQLSARQVETIEQLFSRHFAG